MIQLNENSFKGMRQKTKALVPLTGSMEHAPLPQTNFVVLISSDTQDNHTQGSWVRKGRDNHTDTQNSTSRNQQHFLRVQMGIGASDTQKLPNCTPRALGSGKAEFFSLSLWRCQIQLPVIGYPSECASSHCLCLLF